MSWTLWAQIMLGMTWGAILARYVIEGLHHPLRDRKELDG